MKQKLSDDEAKEKEDIARGQRRVPMEERFRKKWHEWTFGYKEKEKWNDEHKKKEQLKQLRADEKEVKDD